MRAFVNVLCVLFATSLVNCAPTSQDLSVPTKDELAFMTRYGYLPELKNTYEDLELAYTPQSISGAILRLQAFAGIPQTGILDEKTKKMFTKKRCGMKDIYEATRRRRFIISTKWINKTITYRVVNGPHTFAKSRAEELIAGALAQWAPHGGLRFVKKEHGRANIEVSFRTGYHGDTIPFDGPNGVIAHAFRPPLGELHFDDAENWVDKIEEDDYDDVTDLYSTALHELGHTLGLEHTSVESAVMYPYYQATDQLHADDIQGMHELYMDEDQTSEDATESYPSSPFTRITSSETAGADYDDTPDICFTNYDTIQVMQGKIFVFEDEWVWVLNSKKVIEEGYPKKFHDFFVGLPKQVTLIRAIYEKHNGNIVIFFGRNYWEFNSGFHLNHTGDLSDYHLPKQVTDLSTVFLSNFNNKTYLIVDELFWRFDEQTGKMDAKYPKSMSAWRDVPYPVDAAIIWQGDTYFFQGPQFWRFDNYRVQAQMYYPIPVAPVWFPCEFRTDVPYPLVKHTKLN